MSDTVLKPSAITRAHAFALKPDADTCGALAADLGITGLRKLSFQGQIVPDGKTDLRLDAQLGATVVQECVVTAEPVTTRIEEHVLRRYVANLELPEADEIEMPEDDTVDPMPEVIDLSEIMAEALALALPPWPRAEGVDPVDLTVTEPGKAPMTDDDAKPFAGLKSLLDKGED